MNCTHLGSAPLGSVPLPDEVAGCPQCLADGHHDWVHLRQCMECGAVGCCDSSPRRHATRHHAESGHAVIRSLETGESWRWCYVDETLG